MVDLVDLVNGHKLALVQLHIASCMPVQEGFRHADDDITMLVAVVVEDSDCEFQLLRIVVLPVVLELVQVSIELRLEKEVLDDDDALRSEYLILHGLASYCFILGGFESGLESTDDRHQEGKSLPGAVDSPDQEIELLPGRIQRNLQSLLLDLSRPILILHAQCFNDVLVQIEILPFLRALNVSLIRLFLFLALVLFFLLMLLLRLLLDDFLFLCLLLFWWIHCNLNI